jgi:3-oxoadipate enol-lactonase
MPFVQSPKGPRIHYRVKGEGRDTVVLIQGLGMSSDYWLHEPDALVQMGYRVILPDNRGTSHSELPMRPFSTRHMADDIARVLDACLVDKAYVIGVSLGGMVAQEVALRHPQRVLGLGLISTTPGLPFGKLPPWRSLAKLMTLPLSTRGKLTIANAGGPISLLLPQNQHHLAEELLRGWADVIERQPLRAKTFVWHFLAACAHSVGHRLGSIRCPTVVATGDADALINPENSRILARRIGGSHLEMIKDGGHALPMQDKDVVMRMMRWLNSATSARIKRAA